MKFIWINQDLILTNAINFNVETRCDAAQSIFGHKQGYKFGRINMNMAKIVKTNQPIEIITLELSKSELEDILNSVDCMAEKEQRKLLENIPSTEEGRTRLDKYKALKEDLKKIFETVS